MSRTAPENHDAVLIALLFDLKHAVFWFARLAWLIEQRQQELLIRALRAETITRSITAERDYWRERALLQSKLRKQRAQRYYERTKWR